MIKVLIMPQFWYFQIISPTKKYQEPNFLFIFPGPVFIEFPIDVLYPYHMVAKEIGVKGEGKSFMQKVVNW